MIKDHYFLIYLFVLIHSAFSVQAYEANDQCIKKATCFYLNSTKCLDVTLTYKNSKLNGLLQDYDFENELAVHEFLDKWTGLRSVPKCWASIQPLLCTAFFPRCDEGKITYLPQQICRNVKTNCKILDQFISSNNIKIVPSFLNCNDTNLYQPKCKNELTDIKFNASSAKCQSPLVSTDDSNIYYKNVESCALDCDDPLYHKTDKNSFQNFIVYTGSLSLIVVLISVISYLPKWSNLGPISKITFYVQLCFVINYLGWLMQAFMNKKQIVCRADQTLKYSEPNGGLSCLINFVLIYYSAFSILIWYVIMSITLRMNSKKFEDYFLYFHLFAWSSSFIFTIMAIAFSQIDGNFVYGICFVGFSNKISQFIFILIPFTICASIFIYGMLVQAIPVSSMIHQSSKLKENLIERNKYKKTYKTLMICSLSMFIGLLFSYIVYFNKNSDLTEWLDSLNDEIICRLNLNSAFNLKGVCDSSCNKNLKRSLTLDYWIIVFVFGSGILSSFWNFDLITIILWIFEFKQRIDKTVRPDKAESKNVFFEKLLHNKQDPVRMNLSTVTTNQASNNNQEINQEFNNNLNKNSNDPKSNAYKMYHQKMLDKQNAKEMKKNQQPQKPTDQLNQKNNYCNTNNVIEMNQISGMPPFNTLSFNQFNNLQQTQLNYVFHNPTVLGTSELPNMNEFLSTNNDLTANCNNPLNLNELKKRELDNANNFKTHGMSDQNKLNQLINPFDEVRRPDSKAELPNNEPINQLNGNLKMTLANEASKNIQNHQMNNLQLPNAPMQQFDPRQSSLPLALPPNLDVNGMKQLIDQCNVQQQVLRNQSKNLDQQLEIYKWNIFMQLNLMNQSSSRNIMDIETRKREIQQTCHITQTVDSASDTNDCLSIQIHDSDISSIYSLESGASRCSSFRDSKHDKIPTNCKEVYNRLKLINDNDDKE